MALKVGLSWWFVLICTISSDRSYIYTGYIMELSQGRLLLASSSTSAAAVFNSVLEEV